MDYRRSAGVALLIGAVQFVFGMLIAEFLYPEYSTSRDFISDLSATCRETCVVHQPSALIFNSSVSFFGVLVLLGAYYLWRDLQKPGIPVLFSLAGTGALGVGIFPESTGMLQTIHMFVSFVAFLFGGLSAIAAHKLVEAPFSHFSVIMGLLSLGALVLFGLVVDLGLGLGGMERMITYPIILWIVGFGSYLVGSAKK